jgi:hypothetical protein
MKILILKQFKKTGAIAGGVSTVFGLISDLLHPIAPFSSYLFFASAFSIVVIFITMRVKSTLQEKVAPALVVSIALMIFSGALFGYQGTEDEKSGVLASKIPALQKLQSSLGVIQEDIAAIKKSAENIEKTTARTEKVIKQVEKNTKENTEATRKVAEAVQESTKQIVGSLAEMQKGFSALTQSGGVIANPTRPEQFYHNARVYELRGDYGNARRSYNRYFTFKLDFLDPHLRYQTFLKIQEGRAGAREIYSAIYENDPRPVVEFARILLFTAPERTEMLKKFITKNPDFAPAYYELSREFSEDRKGFQTLADKRSELKALQEFSTLNNQGKFIKYFVDKGFGSKWIKKSETRQLMLKQQSVLLMPVSASIHPTTKKHIKNLCCKPTFCFSSKDCATKQCRGKDWKEIKENGFCRRETKQETVLSYFWKIYVQISEKSSDPVISLLYAKEPVGEGIWKNDKFLYAKKLTTTVPTGKHSIISSSLPTCPGSPTSSLSTSRSWTDCIGTLGFISGRNNGWKYAGEWKDSKRHGQGTLTISAPSKLAGDKYVGEWKGDRRHGQGIYTYGDSIKKTSLNIEHIKNSNNSTEFIAYLKSDDFKDNSSVVISYSNSQGTQQGPYKLILSKEKFILSFVKKLISQKIDLNLPISKISHLPDFPYNSMIRKLGEFETPQFTLLHAAAAENHTSVVEKLVNLGASVNGRLGSFDDCKLTPLIVAVDNGNMEVAKTLRDKSADIYLSSRIGNALDVATCRGVPKIIKMLENSGPKKPDPCRCGRGNSKECQISKGRNKGRLLDLPLCRIRPPITQRK